MPVPQYRPCAYRDDDVLPVQELSHFGGGSRSGGCETTVSMQFFEHISRPKIHGVRNSSGCPTIIVVTLGFMENDNPVCIRAGCHIVDAPYIGGFGENLLVD